MSRLWRNRGQVWEALKEIGCGLLTVMFFALPVWVLTISWRGPVFALTSLLVLGGVLAGIIAANRVFRRSR